jgi:hypothetical protein
MRRMKNAEPTKLSASSAIVSGAPISRIMTPAAPGPATIATDWLACSLALPSLILSEGTSSGR